MESDVVTNLGLKAYGKQMVAGVTGLPGRHGAFLSNCPAHCQTGYVCKATG